MNTACAMSAAMKGDDVREQTERLALKGLHRGEELA